MGASDYYPAGAYNDPSAPYNEPVPPKTRTFGCDVSVTLEAVVDIPTQNYNEYVEEDEMGKRLEVDTDGIDWVEEYNENCYTIPDLLALLEGYVKDDLERYKGLARREKDLNKILKACQGWKVTETYVEEA